MNAATTFLDERLDRLSNFEPSPFPVISLYLNTQRDGSGKPTFDAFVRKELPARAQTYTPRSEERESYEKDIERIERFLHEELDPSSQGLAIFACHAENLFETVQVAAPVEENELYVQAQPHLYTLAKLHDQYPTYAAVIADTDEARIFVFGMRTKLDEQSLAGVKFRRTQSGGWSQARYQRRIDEFRDQHVKEIVDELERTVREDNIQHILFAGDEVLVPLLRNNLPKHLAEKVVDILKLDIRTPEHELLQLTLDAMRKRDAETDGEKVRRVLGAYRSGGLGVVGVRQTLTALRNGQVDELLIGARPEAIEPDHEKAVRDILENELGVLFEGAEETGSMHSVLTNALVTRARQTGATVTFIEDPGLLQKFGGVGALLRYRHEGDIQ
jgi:peptide subunit release factor 1 (eRF1)